MTAKPPTSVDVPVRRAVPVPVALLVVVVGGGCAAAQAAVNGRLGAETGSPIWAAAISNTLAGVLFVSATLLSGR
ncbi:MAG: DMT family transporter, partial [Stackebrandtia sp.]